MASETPADAIFFIKEGQNEPEGPHTKDRVLGWYNEKTFENRDKLLFAFLMAGDEPTPHTKYHTLGDLIKSNGLEDPFLHEPINRQFVEALREVVEGPSNRQSPPTSSSSAADVKIFFKDEQNEPKGHPKQHVLRWYKGGSFENRDTRFAFMTGDEQPTEQTEFLPLDTLIERYGVDDPFRHKPPTNEKNQQALEALRVVFEILFRSIPATTAPAVTNAPAAATAEKKPKQPENPEHTRLANVWATYYLDVLQAYKTDDWNRVNLGVNNPIIASMSPEIVADTTFRKACCSALLGMLIKLDYAYCKECHSVFHKYREMVMHVTIEHKKKPDVLHEQMRAVNEIMKQICEPWLKLSKEAEDKHTKEVIKKHRGVFFASQALRPEQSFVDYLDRQYDRAFYDYADNIDSINFEQIYNKNFAPMIAKMIPRLKKEDYHIVSKIVRELDAHIGENKTRCLQCKLVTGTKEQYYQHMRTFGHIQKANGMDLITLAVNMYKDKK